MRTAGKSKPRTPGEVRSVFGSNLKILVKKGPPISQICSDLKIHRSQFNRFLNGETFPKPDLLLKISTYFKVDPRIYTEDIEVIAPQTQKTALHPEVSGFVKLNNQNSDTEIMPTGFYKFIRRSFIRTDLFQWGLIYIYETDGLKFAKGFMPRAVARDLGISPNDGQEREFRGMVLRTDGGVAQWASHRNSQSFSLTYLELKTYVEKKLLVGFCVRTMASTSTNGECLRAVYEHLGHDFKVALKAARSVGYVELNDVPQIYRRLLTS